MEKTRITSQAVCRYSFKVWLTSMLLSPFLYIILNITDLLGRPEMNGLGIFVFWLLCLAFAFVFSFISYLIFNIVALRVHNLGWTDIKIKHILAVTGFVITLIPLAFVFGHDEEYKDAGTIKLIIAYCTSTIIGIYYYKIKPVNTLK